MPSEPLAPAPNRLKGLNLPSLKLHTPVRVQLLSPYIHGYLWHQYLLDGFTYGFRLGYTGPRISSSSPNLKSCVDDPATVHKKLHQELQAHRVRGPFCRPPFPNLKVSPIGLVPKKTPGEFRLIHHLSYAKGTSVNDFIETSLASVSYSSFDDATSKVLTLGPGTILAKTDIDSAFRLIPIHPDDHCRLGFRFNELFYFDTCLPMGVSSSCAIFERFSSGLQFAAETHLNIQHIVHILDDFLFLSSDEAASCQSDIDSFLRFCDYIGVPIKKEKTESARTVITFMGLELDSVAMEARLPADKLSKVRGKLLHLSRSRNVTLKELQSLLGLLNFCCQVVLPGRCFLRRLIDLTKNVTKPNHRITLNKESRRDLQAWSIFIDQFNGRSLLLARQWFTTHALHLYTDASGSIGFGAIFRTHWTYGTWPESISAFHITFKELFPIVLSVEVWGPLLRNKCIVLHTDNMAVVHVLNNQTSKNPDIMVLVRRFVIACMRQNILIHAEHIPGIYNVLPDLLSRLQIDKFRELAPNVDPEPTTLSLDHLTMP